MAEGGHKGGYKDTSKIHKPIVTKKSNSLSNATPILEPRNIADFLPKVTARSNPSIDSGLSEADSIELLKKQVFDCLSKIIGESNTVDILTAVSRTPIEGEEIWDSIDSLVAEVTSAEQYFNIRIDFNRLRELYLFPPLKSKVEPTSQKDILDKENPIVQALSYIWGTVIGDWNNQQDPLQILANVGVGLIPVVDQVLDLRDFTAHLYYMIFQKDYKDPMRWVGLGLTAIGAIPMAGSIAKGLGKLALSSDAAKAVRLYAEPLLEQIRQINPEWVDDIGKLKATINENWDAGVAASKELWMDLLGSVKDRISGVPLPPGWVWGADKLTSAKLELLSTITEIQNLSNSMYDEALEAIKSEIEFILDELNRVSKELLDKRKLEKAASSRKVESELTPVKSSENTSIKNNIEPKDLLTHPSRNRQLEDVLTGNEKVPVIIDNSLTTNTVEVHYIKSEDGLVDANSIYITAGPSASSTDIMLHSRSVLRIKRYSGLYGKTIKLKNQLLDLFFNIENPEIASLAWEAMLEVEKLEDIINFNMRQRSKGIDIRPDEEFKAEIKNLEVQLAKHRKTYESLDDSEGVGFIAVRGKKSKEQSTEEALTVLREMEAVIENKIKSGVFKSREEAYLSTEDMRSIFLKTTAEKIDDPDKLQADLDKFKLRTDKKFEKFLKDIKLEKDGTHRKAQWRLEYKDNKTLSDVETEALQQIEELKKAKLEGRRSAPKKIPVKPESKQRKNIFQEYNISHQELRGIINKISDDILNNAEVKNAVSKVNKGNTGSKSQPNKIESGIDLLGIVKHYQEGLHGGAKKQSRFYQFGSDPDLVIAERLELDKTRKVKPNTNAIVSIVGEQGSAYNPGVIKVIEDIQEKTNFDDQDIADTIISLVSEGKIPESLNKKLNSRQKKQLAGVTYLILGRESVRNKRNLIHSSVLLTQVAKGEKPLINAIDELPMSPKQAKETVQLMDDVDFKQKHPASNTKRAKNIQQIEQLETKAINDFLFDKIQEEKINFKNKEEVIDYSEKKIKEIIFNVYGIRLQ